MRYAIFMVFLILAPALWAQQAVEATIQGGNVRPVPLGLPLFEDQSGNSGDIIDEFREVVAYDLRSTGLFRDLPIESYIAENVRFEVPVQFANWDAIGAEGLLKGSISSEDGNLIVKFRIYDVIAQREMGEGTQLVGPVVDWRRMAHKTADAVYSAFTGEGAYFDSRIVFVSETGPKGERAKQLAIMDTDGANMKTLTDGSALVLAPRWAGNTRDITYTSYESGQPQVVLMNTETGEKAVLDDLPGLAFSPRVSQDGMTMLVSLIDDRGNTDIFSIDTQTGERSQLTTEPSIETAPSFSPDGSQIVFESDRSGNQQLYVMPAEGGDAVRISRGEGRYASPVWSPEGDLIAFTKIEDGQFHIGIMGVDGEDERLITEAFIDEGPSWAPNGRVIVFYRETAGEGGAPKLMSISLTGRNMVEVPTPEFASDPSWSNLLP